MSDFITPKRSQKKKIISLIGIAILFLLVLNLILKSVESLDDSTYQTGGFRVGVNTIDRTINVGEEAFENILIVNTGKKSASVGITTNMSVLIDKELLGIVSTNNKVEIPEFESRNIIIRIKGVKAGIYLGNIYFSGEKIIEKWIDRNVEEEGYHISVINSQYIKEINITNTTYVLPVRVIVKGVEPQLVDLKSVLDKINVPAGESVGFEVSAFNLGFLSNYTVELHYEVIDGEGKIIESKQESIDLKNAFIIERKLNLPKELKAGEYELVVSVFYNNKKISTRERFNVIGGEGFSPVIRGFLSRSFNFYLSFILAFLFVALLSIIGAYYFIYLRKKLFEKEMEEIKKKSMYVFPDFEKLPKSRFAYIGMVADTRVKTYLDHTQLNRHILIAGGTGAGKSVSGMVIVEELLKKGGYPVLVFDPTGQWTGFSKKNDDKRMASLYKKFDITAPKSFDVNVIEVNDTSVNIDILLYLSTKGLTVLKLDKLSPLKLDKFIEESLDKIYNAHLPEKENLKSLIVLDEVHRLLPKYGGKKAHVKLEQAVREFRKWGIGLLMISQVLTDFKGAIRGNIGTEIQMRTLYEGDIKRVKERHGSKYSNLIAKLPIGVGMIESSEYNKGVPYFVEFRPLLHSPYKANEGELKGRLKASGKRARGKKLYYLL